MMDLQNETNNFKHNDILKLKNQSLRLLDNHQNFPMMVVRIPDVGPSIIYQDFTLFPDEEFDEIETSTILQNLVINSTVSLICGTQYVEGVFDLPTAGAMNYRQLLISFQIPNNTDVYRHEDFVIISVFIPQDIAEYFPSMTYMI